MNLPIDLRPKSFDQVVGQPEVIELLSSMKELPRLLLFHGPSGVGKTTTARILAHMWNCIGESKPCGECKNCRNQFLLVQWDVPTKNKVDDVVAMMNLARMATPEGTKRIILADEAHGLTPAAFDKLLDFFEQKPTDFVTGNSMDFPTIFIFSTTELHKIPQTIVSRATVVHFKKIKKATIIEHLRKIAPDIEEQALEFIATTSGGNLRTAMQTLGSVLEVEDWKTVLDPEGDSVKAIIEKLVNRDPRGLLELLETAVQASSLRDVVERVIRESSAHWGTDPANWRAIIAAFYRVQFSVSISVGVAQLYMDILQAIPIPIVKDESIETHVRPSGSETTSSNAEGSGPSQTPVSRRRVRRQ